MRLDVTRLKAIPILEVATNSLGRLVGRVTLDSLRAKTTSEINAVPVEVEQLVWLLLLNNGWGKYGLHTFLSGSAGNSPRRFSPPSRKPEWAAGPRSSPRPCRSSGALPH